MTQEFVTLPREVVGQAIRSLERYCFDVVVTKEVHAALRSALDQPQANQPAMTPIAQRKLDSLLAEGYTISGYSIYHERKHQHGFVTGAGLVGWWRPESMEHVQPQGEQEPVGFVRQIDIEQMAKTPSDWGAMFGRVMGFNTVPVYTHPQPKREPLTDEQVMQAVRHLYQSDFAAGMGFPDDLDVARAIEAAHNIK